jgi:iron complex outermembrane receptor protein
MGIPMIKSRFRPTVCRWSRYSFGVYALLALSFQLTSRSALAEDALDRQIKLNIPANTRLEDALIEWGAKAEVTVMINTPTVDRQTTRGIRGTLSARSALADILRGSGLSYTEEGGRIRVVPVTTLERSAQRTAQPESAPASASSDTQSTVTNESVAQKKAEAATISTRNDARQNYLEEILVTAQKRAERVFDVPMSVIAITGDELEKRNVTNIDDLSMAVPGMYSQSNGSYGRYVFLRGLSNSFGNSSLVGLYLDEASVTSYPSYLQPDIRTYDLERVEVLLGPQGTLYGDGSVGGTIRFITKDPQLQQFAFDVNAASLFTQDGAPSQRITPVVNVPIVENVLGLRIAGTFDHEGGWMNQPAANQKDINYQNLADVRVKGLWQPTAQLTVKAMAVIHRNDEPPNMGEDSNGNFTQVFNLTTTPSGIDNYDAYNLTLTYDLPFAQLLSTTSYLDQNRETHDLARQFQLTPPGTPKYDLYYPYYALGNDTFTDELRLTSTGSGVWQWTIGGIDRHVVSNISGEYYYAVPGPPGTPLPSPYTFLDHNTSKSWAVFGDTSLKLTEKLTLGAGLRYFRDDQENLASPQAATFHALTPRAYAKYNITDQVNTYVSASKGFRSGGFNYANTLPTYAPESVWTYELGAKMSLMDGRLSANAALFYTNYTNYQVNGLVFLPNGQPMNLISNAGRALSRGVEWGLAWRPTDEWSLGFNGELVHSVFTHINVTDSSYDVGDPLDFSAKYGYAVTAQRNFRLNDKPWFVRLDYNLHGPTNYRNRSEGYWYHDTSDPINMLNLNIEQRWSDYLSFGVFAQNLLNDRGLLDPDANEGNASRPRPRTVGVEFTAKFE